MNFVFLILSALLATVFAKLPNQSGRIIGGEVAENGKYPFSASITVTTSDGRYFCGGALISTQFVITAAHCIENGNLFTIQLGSVSLSKPDDNSLTLESNSSFIHPSYSNLTYENDVALIELPEAIAETHWIQALNLPTSAVGKNANGRIMGWGQTDDMTSGPVDLLHYVDVIALDNTACRHDYGDVVTDDIVCVVGNFNEGICIGDIGSPLVSYTSELERAVHDGIAVFFSGEGCEDLHPSGFTRTFSHIDWIKEITKLD